MNKADKNKVQEKPKVEPLGDLKIADARGKQAAKLHEIF